MKRDRCYFDYAAATPTVPEVQEAMKPYFREDFGNASSIHRFGLQARDALSKARQQVAALINAGSEEHIIFTSSGAESANMAIKGVAFAQQKRRKHIIALATDHPAILRSIEWLESLGWNTSIIPVDSTGYLNYDLLRGAIQRGTALICMHLANYDVGVIQPVKKICALAQEHNIPTFVDCSYAGGWFPIDVADMGTTFLSLSPHRFYGPKGVGVLYLKPGTRIHNLIHGGAQEMGLRAGTENIPAIVGAGAAAELAQQHMQKRIDHTAHIQNLLWKSIAASIPKTSLNGPELGKNRITTNLNISFAGVEGENLMLLADSMGLAISSGTACASKSIDVSPVLAAMKVEHSLARGSVILTSGMENTLEDVRRATEILTGAVGRLRGASPTS